MKARKLKMVKNKIKKTDHKQTRKKKRQKTDRPLQPYLGPEFGGDGRKKPPTNPCCDWHGMPGPSEFATMDFSERFIQEPMKKVGAQHYP